MPGPTSAPSIPLTAAPPRALLTGVRGGDVAGDLGSFTWDGLVSDAPWIVGSARGAAAPGARLSIAFRPGRQVVAWRARWAPIAGGQPGTPGDGGGGSSGPIIVSAPRTAGSWSLQLSADFGREQSATWYWRVEVTR